MARNCISLLGGESRVCIVFGPCAFVSKTKAAAQNIRLSDASIEDDHRRSIRPIRRSRCFAIRGVEIEIRLQAAGKDIQFRVTICPECPDQSAASCGRRVNERAATTRSDRMFIGFESITGELGKPRRLAPFKPNPLGRHTQQVGASQGSRPFGVGKGCAQACQIVAEHVANRARADLMGERGGTAQVHNAAVLQAVHDKGRSTLRNAIGQPHGCYDYTAGCARIICGTERPSTGVNPDVQGARVVNAAVTCALLRDNNATAICLVLRRGTSCSNAGMLRMTE